jgi:hypothetical protein
MVEGRFEACQHLGFRVQHVVWDTTLSREVPGSGGTQAEVAERVRAWNEAWEKSVAHEHAAELRRQYDDYMKTAV